MTKQTKATLKSYFNTGDVPTETQFANLIDSFDMDGRINLSDYGLAEGNTGAQNDAAFTAAIAAAQALGSGVGGGYLMIPAGNFFISAGIDLPNRIGLIGAGPFATKIKAAVAIPGGMVRIVGTALAYRSGQRIQGVCVHGMGIALIGIRLSFATYSNIIHDVYITDVTECGIQLVGDVGGATGCWGNTIEKVYIYDSDGRGIELQTSSNGMNLIGCNIHTCAKAGIYSLSSSGVNIYGGCIETCGSDAAEPYGILVEGGTVVNINGTYFERNGDGSANSADIYCKESVWNGVDGLTITAPYFNGSAHHSQNAISVGGGANYPFHSEISVVGGHSNSHMGVSIVVRAGGSVHDYGFVSDDPGGSGIPVAMTAAPATGTAKIGDIVWRTNPSSGAAPGWVCTHSGTFSAATDNTGDTDGVTAVITGMTDTSDFYIGQYVDVSAGFPTTGPYRILAVTATSLTLDVNSNAIAANITVDTSDPTWTAMANLA